MSDLDGFDRDFEVAHEALDQRATDQIIRSQLDPAHDWQDTLVEAIASELERDYEFITVSDDRLTAAVNVSKDDDENFLADLDEPEDSVDYVSILADLQAGDPRLN